MVFSGGVSVECIDLDVVAIPTATFQACDSGSIQMEGVIAGAAVLHISTTTTIEAFITGIPDEGFCCCCSCKRVISGGADLIDEGLGEGAGAGTKDHITLASCIDSIGMSP